ncbi:MAG: UvrD-helicase domain-containing protein [Chloroflexi bacterium]|nr:UvrD-helicase domain-containing protein [Chloroflexota bacterium]
MPSPILEGLNPAQREAVTAPPGPILVVAGPGSGKTRVLTHRVAYLVEDGGVRPWHILAVTFTNKAAREMKERLFRLLPSAGFQELTLGTFHASCARILRRDGQGVGVPPDFVIYDDNDQEALMAEIIEDLDLDEKQYRPGSVLAAVSRAKSELISPESFPRDSYWQEILQRLYSRYEERLAKNKALDFDDLLTRTVELFREHPPMLDKYRQRFQQVLVDEFQDTNIVQYELVKLLTQIHRCVFAVGDEDQSIYSWRGADSRNVRRFRQDYPEARVMLLEENYRSTQNILDAAQGVIIPNPGRVDKSLWTQNPPGLPLTLFEAYDQEEEAQFVLHEMERLLARGEYGQGDFAVMYRTNAQSRALEETFLRAGMPYRLVGATRFYARREVKDVLAYLRVIHNPQDDLSLLRIINVPPRKIGKKTIAQLGEWAEKQRISLWEALQRVGDEEAPLDSRGRRLLLGFLKLLEELRIARQRAKLRDLLTLVLERSGYPRYIRDGTEEGEDRWANVLELENVAQAYDDLRPEQALTTFLEEVALVSDVDNLEESARAPHFLTLHMAKGLEFPVVFIIGLEEGILPHSRSSDDLAALEEERRLFYVGITRAKSRVYLVYAFRRSSRGFSQVSSPSRFLFDIPPHLLKGGEGWLRQEAPRVTATSLNPSTNRKPRFGPGDKVRHPQFGEGIVVSSKVLEDDEEVTVAFVGDKPKRLLASFADMEKV